MYGGAGAYGSSYGGYGSSGMYGGAGGMYGRPGMYGAGGMYGGGALACWGGVCRVWGVQLSGWRCLGASRCGARLTPSCLPARCLRRLRRRSVRRLRRLWRRRHVWRRRHGRLRARRHGCARRWACAAAAAAAAACFEPARVPACGASRRLAQLNSLAHSLTHPPALPRSPRRTTWTWPSSTTWTRRTRSGWAATTTRHAQEACMRLPLGAPGRPL